MAGGKETPRQKMIGMMYLVLTALLALNISKEVLNGFVKVENSLQDTQHTLKGKVAETLTTLEVKYAQNKEKVGPFMDKARDVRERSDNLVNYITQLKGRCMPSRRASTTMLWPTTSSTSLVRTKQGWTPPSTWP